MRFRRRSFPVASADVVAAVQTYPQDDFLNAVGEITASINNPGPGIVMEASDIVRRVCEPNAIYIYGPTAKFYLEDCKVCLVVVVPSGDVNGIRRRIS